MNPDLPTFASGDLMVVLLVASLVSLFLLTLRWPQIAPTAMLMGMQVLGIFIGSAGLYIQHGIVYVVTFFGVLGLLSNMIRGGRPVGMDMPTTMLSLFGILMVFGYTIAPPPIRQISWMKIQMFGALAVLPFMLGRSFAQNNRTALATVSCIAAFSAIYSPLVAAMVFAGNYTVMGASRFASMGGPIGAGKIFGMAAMFMLAVLWQKRLALWKRSFLIAGILAALVVSFATQSRGPFLGLLLGTVAMFLIGRKLSTKALVIIIVPMVLLLGLALLAPQAAWERIVGRVAAGEDVSSLSTGRIYIYLDTLRAVPEAPMLGHGTGSYGVFTGVYHKIDYPHNLILEILYENGLVGVAIFLCFAIGVLRAMVAFAKNPYLSMPLQRAYIGLVIQSAIVLQFSSHIANAPEFWFTCGLVSGPFVYAAAHRTAPDMLPEVDHGGSGAYSRRVDT